MIQLFAGDARDVLPTLAADSVHTCVTSPPYYALRSYLDAAHPDKHHEIGSESSPDEYLATMVAVFREVRRVLHPTGSVFCNLGDSYSDKQLLMMPARLALALQADGWWVRSAITWCKPSPMPESCTDRPTSATEMVYLLTKRANYFYDSIAIREDAVSDHRSGNGYKRDPRLSYGGRGNDEQWDGIGGTRNARNWWVINSKPFPDAHFATFPPELAERCIRAGTSERGCCAACGKPWVRTTEAAPDTRKPYSSAGANAPASRNDAYGLHKVLRDDGRGGDLATIQRTTTGWQPSCDHGAEVVPCRVLDCFAGAGTTLLVADRLQRDAIGIELNVDYTRMAMERCRADAPLFTSFPPAEPPEDERIADLFQDMAAE